MTAIDPSLLDEVLRLLAGPPISIAEAMSIVPRRPGLYAVHGDRTVWDELGLGDPSRRTSVLCRPTA